MNRLFLCLAGLAVAGSVTAADLLFPLETFPVNEPPPGFVSLLAGAGQPGDWRVKLDEVGTAVPVPDSGVGRIPKRAVLAQLSEDATDERFPMLIYDDETFADFKLTCRIKTVSGTAEQMAGIAFRVQDEKNFYVVRASANGNTFRFYKVVKGVRSALIGPQIDIPSGVWHDIEVECRGNKIRCALNGKDLISLTDDDFAAFTRGKVGFWTKSDSVSYFTDIRLNYTPQIPLAQTLVDSVMKRYDRLIGLRVYTTMPDKEGVFVVASDKKEDIGQQAIDDYRKIIEEGAYAYGRTRSTVTVSLALRDRNGDVVGVVRAEMERFPGQTEKNAVARAMPIMRLMEQRIRSRRDLIE
jgi:hypothetical protein